MHPRLVICKALLAAGFAILLATILLPNSQLFGGNVYPPSGGGATASPTASPSPAMIAASSTVIPTSAATPVPGIPGAVQAGDCAVISVVTYTTAIGRGLLGGQLVSPGNNYMQQSSEWFTPNTHFGAAWTHYVTPQDITNGYIPLFGLGQEAGDPLCMVYYRHVSCGSNDGFVLAPLANNGNSASTAPQPASLTSTVAGDLAISYGYLYNGTNGVTYTPPTGYTNDCYIAPVTGTADGLYVDHKVLGGAGSTQPGTGTLSSSLHWGAGQFLIQNIGGTQ